MAWISVKDFALMKGVSERAVRKAISNGKYEIREVAHPSRKDQVSYEIWTAEPESAELRNCGTKKCGTAEPTPVTVNNPDIDNQKAIDYPDTLHQEETRQDGDAIDERSSHGPFTPEIAGSNPAGVANYSMPPNSSDAAIKESLIVQPDQTILPEVPQNRPVQTTVLAPASGEIVNLPDLRPRIHEVPRQYQQLVDARVAIVKAALDSGDIKTWQQSLAAGLVCVTQASVIGKPVSLRTLYRWIEQFKSDGALGLCPGYSHDSGRGRAVPQHVQDRVLAILLNPNKVMIGTAIRTVQAFYKMQKREIGCSTRTITRWIEEWKQQNLAQWTLAREGMKAFRETVNKTILRDWTITNVGDAWVSDGHTVEVMIIDPRDGKAKKFEVVAWLDAASRMPVGASINLTENTEAIQISFRNACLFTGYKPLCVYVDNGKAYKSKYFSGSKMSPDDIEAQIDGVFARLGVSVINSQPYNAKAKIIERWWLSLQEQVERLLAGFTGANTQDKPATMKRDEKYLKSRFAHKALTIEEFKQVFEFWSLEIYAQQPHPDFKDKTRMEVFQEGSALIPTERRISPEELNWMLLVIDHKRISNQGITLNKTIYWHDELVAYVGRDLIVRWDAWDLRSILVYDEKDRFICQAPMRRFQDPLVKLRGEDGVSKRELDRELKEIRAIEKKAKQSTDAILERIASATDDMVKIPTTDQGLLDQAPLMPALKGNNDIEFEKVAAPAEPEPNKPKNNKLKEHLKNLGIE